MCVCWCETTIRVQSSICVITYQKGTENSPHNFNPDSAYIVYIYMVYGIYGIYRLCARTRVYNCFYLGISVHRLTYCMYVVYIYLVYNFLSTYKNIHIQRSNKKSHLFFFPFCFLFFFVLFFVFFFFGFFGICSFCWGVFFYTQKACYSQLFVICLSIR